MDRPNWYPKGSLAEPFVPQDISDIALAFPANVSELMPSVDAIPEEFGHFVFGNKYSKRDGADYWLAFQNQWFMNGLDAGKIKAKPGFNKDMVLRHLGAIQGSFEPKHEYKAAAVAYLASLWLEEWK